MHFLQSRIEFSECNVSYEEHKVYGTNRVFNGLGIMYLLVEE